MPTASLTNGTVLRSVILAGLYLTLLAMFAFALGLILRQSAAAISVFVSVLLIVPIIGFFFPQNWQNDFTRFEPSSLGRLDGVAVRRRRTPLAPGARPSCSSPTSSPRWPRVRPLPTPGRRVEPVAS